jgi:hypothetical protein
MYGVAVMVGAPGSLLGGLVRPLIYDDVRWCEIREIGPTLLFIGFVGLMSDARMVASD